MKKLTYLTFVLFCLLVFEFQLQAQNFSLVQSNKNGVYKAREKYTVKLLTPVGNNDSVSVRIIKNYQLIKTFKLLPVKNETILLQESSKQPLSYIVEASIKKEKVSTGLVVCPEKFEPGTKRPKDFKRFWANEKKNLKALEMQVKADELKNSAANYYIADVEINCTGPKPVRGYYAKPTKTNPGTLPVVLLVHAAGVKGEWCLSRPENALRYAKKGALCFDLNAHGMLNGQSQEYYNQLEEGELKDYSSQGVESRDEYYFRGMYLRLIRTLDFLCSQPEWDGKRILVIGESQGGGQCLAAAGLDKRVSAVVATVPAMCDWGATLAGSKGGWPNPLGTFPDNKKVLQTVPYFDAAHLLKNSKATIVVEIGLIDYTCPSNAVFAAVNQSKGKKIILTVPYRGHHVNQKSFQNEWEENIYKPKMKFIDDFIQTN